MSGGASTCRLGVVAAHAADWERSQVLSVSGEEWPGSSKELKDC